MKALLIVDLQNDFLPGGALPAPDGNEIISGINRIIDKFDLVVASKDWHPPDSVHFDKWPPHCVRNTPGADFPAGLAKEKINKEFLKGTADSDDGYSAFEATSADLDRFLRENNVTHLFACGLTTEYCVKASSMDALAKGYHTFVIREATAGVKANPGDEEKAYLEMQDAGINVISIRALDTFLE